MSWHSVSPGATARIALRPARLLVWSFAIAATTFVAGCATREHVSSASRGNDAQQTPTISTPAEAPIPSPTTELNPTTEAILATTETPTSNEGSPAITATAPRTEPEFIQCTPQIRVDRARGILELAAVSVLEVGFLEQYVCSPSTREHESLFVFEGKASELHAALLLAGYKPGAPGSWREVQPPEGQPNEGNQHYAAVPPTGDAIRITVVLPDGTERPLTYFVRASPLTPNADARPPDRFVFAGSRFRTDRRTGVERYVADGSGSIVGLVTFGDETVAAIEVVPDQVSVAAPVWEAFTERMPKPGTRLTLRFDRPNAASGSSPGAVRPSPRSASPRRPAQKAGQTARPTGQTPSRLPRGSLGTPSRPHSRLHPHSSLASSSSSPSASWRWRPKATGRRIGGVRGATAPSTSQEKRPGRDRASGRALPGAVKKVGVYLPLASYPVVRLGQAASLRNTRGVVPDLRYRTWTSRGRDACESMLERHLRQIALPPRDKKNPRRMPEGRAWRHAGPAISEASSRGRTVRPEVSL